MRVFVSVDMEGATGIVHRDQLMPGGYDYERGRKLLTGDVVAAVEAALSVDDVEFVRICDGHGTMRNVLLERLPVGCDLVSGPASSKALCQSEGLDDTFDAMLLVGHHARAGTKRAVLPHTWVGRVIHEVRVNGRVFGEIAINAALAGEFGVPVLAMVGDHAACEEARSDLGDDLVTVSVKRGTGPAAAICLPPATTEQEIRLGVLTALGERRDRAPFRVPGPVDFAIVTHTRALAERAALVEGVERTGDREVTVHRPNYREAVIGAWKAVEGATLEMPEWLK